jgi:hypothetical protein
VEVERHTHERHIHSDHPDHPDHISKINDLDWSGCNPSTSSTLTTDWPSYLLADESEVVLRGELAEIEQEFLP